jgi:hypothetical protein
VFLILATQRGVVRAIGGGGVRANMSESLVGVVTRSSESRHVTGGETELPDIRPYSKGVPGYFQNWNPLSGTVISRGRAFLLGKAPDELAYIQRLVAARRHLRDWSVPDMPPLVLDDPGEHQDRAPGDGAPAAPGADDMRARIAAARGEATGNTPAPGNTRAVLAPAPESGQGNRGVPAGTVHPVIPGVPPRGVAILIPLLASGRTSAAAAGLALGVSKTVAYEYLSAMREYGYVEVSGGGRSAGWQLPERPEVPEGKREQVENYTALRRYATLEDLAQAVHDGQVDTDDDARTLLDKVRRIYARKRLTVLPGDEE